MKKIVIYIIVYTVVFAAVSAAAFTASPMLEKHIFMPRGSLDQMAMLPDNKIKKELVFTGVVISGKSRYAFIKTRIKKKNSELKKSIYKEGDEILGSVVYKIFPNYIVLLNQGNKIKIKLYSGNKKRPAPPVYAARNVNKKIKNTKKSVTKKNLIRETGTLRRNPLIRKSINMTTKKQPTSLDAQIRAHERAKGNNILSKSSNPFANALKKAMQNNSYNTSGTNPFLEAIKRAQNKQ